MTTGLVVLLIGYLFSQFYRAILAVMAPVLGTEIGASAGQLADASGLWFLGFALAQFPVGWALDRIGPRRTAGVLRAGAGGGGALLFAAATSPGWVMAAMVLIGVGCAPVLMAAYYILARSYPAAVFATLAGVLVGVGSLGNLAAALPLAWAIEAFGWRAALIGLAALTVGAGAAILTLVRDPPMLAQAAVPGGYGRILRTPGLWLFILFAMVSYAPAAGIRGLWAGPYAAGVLGLDVAGVGQVALGMAAAMILGNLAYGPLDRILGTRKFVTLGGSVLCALAAASLWALPQPGVGVAVALLIAVGFFGSTYPMMMAHGRAFFPPDLTGRGVTLVNAFCLGGVGVFQIVSARVHGAALAGGAEPAAAFGAVFGFFAAILALGCVAYLFVPDRTD
ncbi:MAG: MFS transporter [Gemmobacter sp.]